MNRRLLLACWTAVAALSALPAWSHHGWSDFDQSKPLYLEGHVVSVTWRNPHAELKLELPAELHLPADLATRELPAQVATVDAAGLLKATRLPNRRDRLWEVELGPLTRMRAWHVPEIKPGDSVAVIGWAHTGEQGDAVLRAEYLFVGGKTYAMRSSPG